MAITLVRKPYRRWCLVLPGSLRCLHSPSPCPGPDYHVVPDHQGYRARYGPLPSPTAGNYLERVFKPFPIETCFFRCTQRQVRFVAAVCIWLWHCKRPPFVSTCSHGKSQGFPYGTGNCRRHSWLHLPLPRHEHDERRRDLPVGLFQGVLYFIGATSGSFLRIRLPGCKLGL